MNAVRWRMRLTPLAKLFVATVILAVVGYTGWHYYQREEHRTAATNGTTAPTDKGASSTPSGATAHASANTLRLTGSNTIGSKLAPMLASAWLKKEGATNITTDDSARAAERTRVTGVLRGAPVAVEISSPGSAVAFTCLRDGSCEVGMASRAIKDDETRSLSTLGDMNDPASDHVLGLDGIAIIVNKHNAVGQLALADAARLFSGDYGDWSKVGGRGPVHVLSRDQKSGTYDAFVSTVLRGAAMRKDATTFDDSSKLADAVAADDGGIGFVALSLVGAAKAVAVRDAEGQPLYPTVFTVATEDYPLSRRLHLYTPAQATQLARSFVDFAVSDDGQRVVDEAGFVSLTIRPERPPLPPSAPSQYKKETQGAERLSVNFRFRTGSSLLDTRAAQDIDRVVRFLSQPAQRGKRLALFGFADNVGGNTVNVGLSQKRAQVVATELGSRGITPERILGFGSALPLASNETPDGRDRNRRVEIWLR
jgi:phosphate transport system substrate-binding protein